MSASAQNAMSMIIEKSLRERVPTKTTSMTSEDLKSLQLTELQHLMPLSILALKDEGGESIVVIPRTSGRVRGARASRQPGHG